MGEKFFLRFRQPARSSSPKDDPDESMPSSSRRSNARPRRFLHDHRTRDSLIEYLDDLEE